MYEMSLHVAGLWRYPVKSLAGERLTEAMLASGATCLAYETLRDAQGRLPLLTPMSEVAGRMSIQEGAKYLERPQMGRGILLAGVPGVAPAHITILGGGVVGANAARIAAGFQADIAILDVNMDRLRYLDDIMPPNVNVLYSDRHTIRSELKLADPQGAVFSLWQTANPGAGDFVMFEDHAIGWVELASRDAEGARAFYSALLGWQCETSTIAAAGIEYTEYAVGGTRYGGILPMTAEWGEMPSHWSVYIPVADVDACLARARELGGSVCVPAFDAPGVGRIARLDDPTGAGVYVIRLDPRHQKG